MRRFVGFSMLFGGGAAQCHHHYYSSSVRALHMAVNAKPQYSVVPRTATELNVLVTVRGGELPESHKPSPVRLALVLDVSGSMSGEKVTLLKESVEYVLERLQQTGGGDEVGIITFHTDIHQVSPIVTVTKDNVASLLTLLKNVEADGMTNLSGGLFSGFDQICGYDISNAAAYAEKTLPPIPTNRKHPITPNNMTPSVWLLTDGQQNKGVVDAEKIVAGIRDRIVAQEKRCLVHTFGYGGDHNSVLLGNIAQETQGSYYYVKNNNDIKEMFADCLGGMKSVLASNIVLSMNVKPPIVSLLSAVPTKHGTHVAEVGLKSVYAGEKKDFVLRVALPESPVDGGQTDLGTVRVNYVAGGVPQSVDVALPTVTRQGTTPTGTPDADVTSEVVRFETIEVMRQAEEKLRAGDVAAAHLVLQKSHEAVLANTVISKEMKEGLGRDLKRLSSETDSHQWRSTRLQVGMQRASDDNESMYQTMSKSRSRKL